jgi:hypothetical protein
MQGDACDEVATPIDMVEMPMSQGRKQRGLPKRKNRLHKTRSKKNQSRHSFVKMKRLSIPTQTEVNPCQKPWPKNALPNGASKKNEQRTTAT